MEFAKSVKPYFLGLALVHMWIYCSTHRPTLTPDVSVMTVMYSVLSAALIALFVAIALKHRAGASIDAIPSQTTCRVLDAVAATCMAICAVLLSVPLPIDPAVQAAAGSAAGGLGVGWAYMRWGQFYAKLDIHLAAPLIFCTMAIGSLGKLAIDYLPDIPGAVVMALLPFATLACQHKSLQNVPPCEPAIVYYNPRTVRSLVRLALGVAVFSFATGLVQAGMLGALPSSYHPSVVLHHGGEVVLALALVVWVGVLKLRLDFSRSWKLILALMATALMFVQYFDPEVTSYLLSMVRMAQTFLIVLLFLALGDVARHSQFHPIAVFALGWTVYTLPFMLGNAFGDAMTQGSAVEPINLSLLAWVLVVVMMFVLDGGSQGNKLVFAELNDEGDEDTAAKRVGAVQDELNTAEDKQSSQADPLALRCGKVAAGYGLTPRELEILEMLARGRSKTHIADAFLISENTVRGHVKHIYTKLDVHGKQELVDLLESVEL